MLSFKNCK